MTRRCSNPVYDAACRACPRLADFLDAVRRDQPDYFALPVPPFGSALPVNEELAAGEQAAGGQAATGHTDLLIVGLAPGMHGANRTGRPFTGDYAGILLYQTLHRFGFADRVGTADAQDGLQLLRTRLTNAVKCLPPQNKPLPAEVRQCNHFLAAELAQAQPRAVLALGTVAHQAVLMAAGCKPAAYRFAHGAAHDIAATDGDFTLFDSYHCSRYNTNTRRLTSEMFEAVFHSIRAYLG
jgi:uracil-DNA glycosylase family 4